MSNLKKIIVPVLVAAFVFQCSALEVSAASVLTDSFIYGNVIQFNITPESGKKSDFVEAFPKKIYLKDGTIENPLKQSTNPLPTQYADIPNHFQQYYSDVLYGEDTVESCGSSITALSMMATYLTGYTYFPDELANWFAAKADSDADRVSYASKALGLPFEVYWNWKITYTQLQEGKYVVMQTDSASIFSDSTHFLVLKGITKDGKILVNDPNEDNLLKEELEEKYETGFDETDISACFLRAWVFDKDEVPENIARYTSMPTAKKMGRYESLKLTPAEKQLLARIVYVNAYGECEEGQQMMVEVILNRMLSDAYPDELKEMVRGKDALCDIALLNEAEPILAHYQAVERAVNGPYLLEESVTDFAYTCHR